MKRASFWPLIVIAAVLGLWIAKDWRLSRIGFTGTILVGFLIGVSAWPGIRWYRARMKWLPLGELFCALHLPFYVFPFLNAQTKTAVDSQWANSQAMTALGVFLGSFLLTYLAFLRSSFTMNSALATFCRRIVPNRVLWTMLGVWFTWALLMQTRSLPNLGTALQVLWAPMNACGIMAVANFFFQIGRGALSRSESRFAIGLFVLVLALNVAGGYLNGSVQWLLVAAVAFTMGRKQVPVLPMIVGIMVIALLQLGKSDYRREYWGRNPQSVTKSVNLIEGYSYWLSSGWRNAFEDAQTSSGGVADRVNLLYILATATEKVPGQKAFLDGQTYLQFAEIATPRFLSPNKPRTTLPSETLGIYIGVQSVEGARTSGIAIGAVTEGWLNCGWIGVALEGAFFGVLYGFPAKVSRSLDPNHIGWMLAAIFATYCSNLEMVAAEVIWGLMVALSPAIFALVFLSRSRNDRIMEQRGSDEMVSRGYQ